MEKTERKATAIIDNRKAKNAVSIMNYELIFLTLLQVQSKTFLNAFILG